MVEIPEDIMKTAGEVWATMPKEGAGIYHIAKALTAERQRCAEVAKAEATGYKENGLPEAAIGCLQVRRAILAGGHMTEEITAAAVRYNMQTFAFPPPARHGECLRLVYSIFGDEYLGKEEQGFVTSGKRFVDRETARAIADAAGQTSDRDMHRRELFSEDLW